MMDAEQEPSGGVGTSILVLNDDCLFHILSFLKTRELLKMENVCERFNDVAQMIYRTYHVLDLTINEENYNDFPCWSMEETKEIFYRVGRYIHTLKIGRYSLRPSIPSTVPNFIPQHCRNLQSIHLSGFNFTEQESRDKMTAMCGNVKVAKFTNCGLTDDALISMLKLDQLEVLELIYQTEINGEFLSSLTNIREISLEDCTKVDPQLFVKFCEDHPNLRSFNIMCCDWLNSTCVPSIATYLTGLEELAFSSNISTSDCVALASMPKIKHFVLRSYGEEQNTEQLLLNFSTQDRLEYLEIERVMITPNVAEALTKFTKLKVLKLNDSFLFNDSTLDLLSCTTTLQQLHIHSDTELNSVTASGLQRLIARSPAIEFIDVSGRHNVDDSCIPPILDIVKERSHMLELKVERDKFSEEDFRKYIGNNAFKLKLSCS